MVWENMLWNKVVEVVEAKDEVSRLVDRVKELNEQKAKIEREITEVGREIAKVVIEEVKKELGFVFEASMLPRTAELIKGLAYKAYYESRGKLCTARALYVIADLLAGVKPIEIAIFGGEVKEAVSLGGNINDYVNLNFPLTDREYIRVSFSDKQVNTEAIYRVFNIVARAAWYGDKGDQRFTHFIGPSTPSESDLEHEAIGCGWAVKVYEKLQALVVVVPIDYEVLYRQEEEEKVC